MKKLILSLGMTCMFVFFLWAGLGYKQYGADIINHHLNLEGMILRFKATYFSYDLINDLNNIQDITSTFSQSTFASKLATVMGLSLNTFIPVGKDMFSFVVNAFTILLSPVASLMYGLTMILYITGSSIILAISLINQITQILQFVLFPMFI